MKRKEAIDLTLEAHNKVKHNSKWNLKDAADHVDWLAKMGMIRLDDEPPLATFKNALLEGFEVVVRVDYSATRKLYKGELQPVSIDALLSFMDAKGLTIVRKKK